MYCHKCDLAYDANVRLCNVCGLPLSLKEATPQFRGSPSELAKPASSPARGAEELKGLRGWLILVGIGLIVGMVFRSYLILQNAQLTTGAAMRVLTDSHSAGYIPGFAHVLRFELGWHIFFLAFNIVMAIYFVRESRRFPPFFVAFLALTSIYSAADHFLLSHAVAGSSQQLQQRMHETLANNLTRLSAAAGGSILWICYTLRSERVKATFVN
jgi:uncharacterized protein DUF2569